VCPRSGALGQGPRNWPTASQTPSRPSNVSCSTCGSSTARSRPPRQCPLPTWTPSPRTSVPSPAPCKKAGTPAAGFSATTTVDPPDPRPAPPGNSGRHQAARTAVIDAVGAFTAGRYNTPAHVQAVDRLRTAITDQGVALGPSCWTPTGTAAAATSSSARTCDAGDQPSSHATRGQWIAGGGIEPGAACERRLSRALPRAASPPRRHPPRPSLTLRSAPVGSAGPGRGRRGRHGHGRRGRRLSTIKFFGSGGDLVTISVPKPYLLASA
jgi:hypothetical protein